ncbi:MAG: FAD-binding oxidoreductase [Acidimicrobiales bacterium]
MARPGEIRELRSVMEEIAQQRLVAVVRGAGTKIDWGRAPKRLDVVIDVSQLDRVAEHVVGDLVVRVEPGIRLAELQRTLGLAGQRLSIDEVIPGSTIGGIVATGLSGPRRLVSGGVRDLLIGATVIRSDGKITHSGGKVVKNVAGYDLCKLYTGSYGTLGVLAEAVFRLHPVPPTAAWVSVPVEDAHTMAQAVRNLLSSQLVPVALEIDRPRVESPIQLSVLFEGLSKSVEKRCEKACGFLGSSAHVASSPPRWWAALPGPMTIKATTTISGVAGTLCTIEGAAARADLRPAVRSSPGLGIVYVGFEEDCEPKQVDTFLGLLREHLLSTGGSAVVVRAPAEIKAAVDVWGPVRSIKLMRRIKASFDPHGLLAPGRFVGGI